MATSHITEATLTIDRTPADLARFVRESYKDIAADENLRKHARLWEEPYKKFLRELVPFSHFCERKYKNREDVLCKLVPRCAGQGTPGRDAMVTDVANKVEHSVEITWPIEGKQDKGNAREVNDGGRTGLIIWDQEDMSKQEAAIGRVLTTARKKAVRNYRGKGGSSIIFVFDHSLFWNNNPRHIEMLDSLSERLATIRLLADHVLLMLVFGDQKRIIEVKCAGQKRAL